MTHEQAHASLLDLAYGELDADEADAVRRHAETCPACTAELDAIATARAFAAARDDAAPLPRGRRELVEAARRARVPPARRRRTTALVAMAATIALVAGVTVRVVGDRSRRVVEDVPSPAVDVTAPRPPEPEPVARPSEPPAATKGPAASPRPEQRRESAPRPPLRQRVPAAERPAAPPPATTSGSDVASSPREDGRDRAAQRVASAPAAAAPSAASHSGAPLSAEPRRLVADVDRRAAAGDLATEERRVRCGGADIARTAFVAPGSRVVRLTVRRGDERTVDGWYDEGGTLRAVRVQDGDRAPVLSYVDAESAPASIPSELPVRAPAVEALGTQCAW